MDHVIDEILRLINHYLANIQPKKWEDIKDDKAFRNLVLAHNQIVNGYYVDEYKKYYRITAKGCFKEYYKNNHMYFKN